MLGTGLNCGKARDMAAMASPDFPTIQTRPLSAACAAERRATGTRNGEQLT